MHRAVLLALALGITGCETHRAPPAPAPAEVKPPAPPPMASAQVQRCWRHRSHAPQTAALAVVGEGPLVRVTATTSGDSLLASAVGRLLEHSRDLLQHCLADELAGLTSERQLALRFAIDPDGHLTSDFSLEQAPAAAACVRATLQSLELPGGASGHPETVDVTLGLGAPAAGTSPRFERAVAAALGQRNSLLAACLPVGVTVDGTVIARLAFSPAGQPLVRAYGVADEKLASCIAELVTTTPLPSPDRATLLDCEITLGQGGPPVATVHAGTPIVTVSNDQITFDARPVEETELAAALPEVGFAGNEVIVRSQPSTRGKRLTTVAGILMAAGYDRIVWQTLGETTGWTALNAVPPLLGGEGAQDPEEPVRVEVQLGALAARCGPLGYEGKDLAALVALVERCHASPRYHDSPTVELWLGPDVDYTSFTRVAQALTKVMPELRVLPVPAAKLPLAAHRPLRPGEVPPYARGQGGVMPEAEVTGALPRNEPTLLPRARPAIPADSGGGGAGTATVGLGRYGSLGHGAGHGGGSGRVLNAGPAGLDTDTIRGVIARIKPQVAACFQAAGSSGTVPVTFTIAADGKVERATVVSADSATLGACVLDLVQSLVFPAPRDGQPIEIKYPFRAP